jgi:NADH:ubiquinone oxidoreductase subunit 3 (subunit A)
MRQLLLSPPVAFIIILAVSLLLSFLSGPLGFKRKAGAEAASTESYACGENVPSPRVQPDYSQFFPFAFFFTILHVVSLMVATVPTATVGSFTIAVIYLAGAVFGLFLLFGRNN